jgi:hypothetical protein
MVMRDRIRLIVKEHMTMPPYFGGIVAPERTVSFSAVCRLSSMAFAKQNRKPNQSTERQGEVRAEKEIVSGSLTPRS